MEQQELQAYVGKFVACTRNGVRCLGMIDEVHGDCVGFVTTHADGSWSGSVVKPADCVEVSGADAATAYRNAVKYFANEAQSWRQRIAMRFKIDKPAAVQARMHNELGKCLLWQARLREQQQTK